MSTLGHRGHAADSSRPVTTTSALAPATGPVQDPAASAHTVIELAPGMRGRWLVTTQGSSHFWDLDAMTYTRRPRPTSRSGPFRFDSQTLAITHVHRWPRVGATSLVYLADPVDPKRTEHWRRSSRIESIIEIAGATTA